MPRIALDAMGGDHAPATTVAGALLALADGGPDLSIQLVGKEEVVRAELAAQGVTTLPDRLSVVHASEVIEMTDKPTVAIRGKRDSSMVVGLRLQADGQSDGFVSAGNTGAQMAASAFVLRLHDGLTRPAISTLLPTTGAPLVMLDSGANVDCSPQELVQFARLGAVYAEDILGRTNPAIGLLSVGEEAEKGSLAVKEAHALLVASGLNFVGNVEGRDLPTAHSAHGPFDVVVCDGFTGNVVLKFYEAVAPMIIGVFAKAGLDLAAMRDVMSRFDYASVGGAPLLGVRGVSIICHGKSSAEAIKNAVKVGALAVDHRMSEHIGRSLRATPPEGLA